MAVSVHRRAQPKFIIAGCLVSDVVGDMVGISSAPVAGVYQVSKIDITASPVELPLGMIILKATNTLCVVQVGGEIQGVYAGLTPGKQLFINTLSRLTHMVPTHPSSGIKSVHPVAQALADNVLFLRIQTPSIIRA